MASLVFYLDMNEKFTFAPISFRLIIYSEAKFLSFAFIFKLQDIQRITIASTLVLSQSNPFLLKLFKNLIQHDVSYLYP
jgi:hypothetical protein